MAQFVAIDPKAEITGDAILPVVEGMGVFRQKALEILANHQVVNPRAGQWYRQQSYLDALKIIAESIGDNTLFMIGKQIPEKAVWPPHVDTVVKGLASIDVAYHLNHRIGGLILFDMATGRMREGIGHYGFSQTGERAVTMVCNNPYPCAFDRGIIESAAKKFAPPTAFVRAVHDAAQPCRKKGADACTYHVTW